MKKSIMVLLLSMALFVTGCGAVMNEDLPDGNVETITGDDGDVMNPESRIPMILHLR